MMNARRAARETRRMVAVVVGMMFSAICVMFPFQGDAIAENDALDATVLIEGAQGSHPDGSIPILSFSAGITRSASTGHLGGGGSTQRPEFSGVTITKVLDEATPMLNLMAAMGTHFSTVEIVFRKKDKEPKEYLIITLKDVTISSVQTKEGVVGERPIEAVTFAFSQIIWTAFPDGQDSKPIVGGWDIQKGLAL